MLYDLPDFRPVPKSELRELWIAHRDEDVRRLILEIERTRRVLDEVEQFRMAIDRAWKADVGGQLVGLERLRCLLQDERIRIGILWGAAR